MPKVKKEDNVLYAGADEWVNTRTGQVITANQIIKKTDRKNLILYILFLRFISGVIYNFSVTKI